MLTNPAYGGSYAYGRTEQSVQHAMGNTRKAIRRKPRDQWLALIPNAHEGYVSWEQFEHIQRAISNNVRGGEHSGAPQGGAALLAGLLRCRRCGRKLIVGYTGRDHDALRYMCWRGWLDTGQRRCIAFVEELLMRQSHAR